MAAAAGENWWRRTLAIGFLSFAALGLAGCDNSGSGGEESTEQEAPAEGEETAEDEATDATEEESTTGPISPTEGEGPAERDDEQEDG
ncbi:hypothetical protein [Kocuria arenosa]|jgi:hypothetical protein|uniref:hypothetical protein n=1 Tax=Kocuria arenosa TaxID=3071446 RepID=UPI0034D39853